MTQQKILVSTIAILAGLIVGLSMTLIYVNTHKSRESFVQISVNSVLESTKASRTGNTGVTVAGGSNEIPDLTNTQELLGGLDIPWDIEVVEIDNTKGILFTERKGTLTFVPLADSGQFALNTEELTNIEIPATINAAGEGGLMALAIDPSFENNRYIYLCHNSRIDQVLQVVVSRWVLSQDFTLGSRKNIVTQIPAIESQRHSGCQLEFDGDENIWIGTGDAATGTNPQDPTNLGGKILRVDRDGKGIEGNLTEPFDARIYSYGHRNVQGLTILPDGESLEAEKQVVIGFSMEHGPEFDDELNFLLSGNAGWDPVPDYNESVSMTDLEKYPTAFEAVWSSGESTVGASDIQLLSNAAWERWESAIAVAALDDEGVLILDFDGNYANVTPTVTKVLDTFGRIRSLELTAQGGLLLLTSNGDNQDKIIYVTPS